MWHLLEDFLEQNLVMKGFVGLGWLCALVMVASLIASATQYAAG